MSELSHTDDQGKARMVDVGHKPDQLRIARAIGQIGLKSDTIQLIRKNQIKKGDVLTIAEIAGIQGGKKTSELIPLCHPLPITKMHVRASITEDCVIVESEARCTGKTGIEMEALTAVNIALLTIYDMCKAVDDEMEIFGVRLVEKTKENE
ncbi:MAG: cyclic pyranopterin monophosphate synthase MoaC [Bacteroidales bacterium]|nr:cyclic pyranopterin monophosphate synthase MoaC [Bacteroidales bacterium]MCF8399645.1 cyclic pyranopterin monophosphate synthase MoaC [Bacteroidales bacterium]